jgi:hypothetical protein
LISSNAPISLALKRGWSSHVPWTINSGQENPVYSTTTTATKTTPKAAASGKETSDDSTTADTSPSEEINLEKLWEEGNKLEGGANGEVRVVKVQNEIWVLKKTQIQEGIRSNEINPRRCSLKRN